MFTRKIMTLALATAFVFGTAALQSANDPAALEAALANLSKELEKADTAAAHTDAAPQPAQEAEAPHAQAAQEAVPQPQEELPVEPHASAEAPVEAVPAQ